MALIVETGSNVPNANGYASVAALNAIIATTPEAGDWDALTDEEKGDHIIAGTAFLDTYYRFYGKPKNLSQSLQWPRTKNFDNKGNVIAAGVIPAQLVQALALTVRTFLTNPEFMELGITSANQIAGFGLGGLSVTFKEDEVKKEGDKFKGKNKTTDLLDWSLPQLDLTLRSIGVKIDSGDLIQDRRV